MMPSSTNHQMPKPGGAEERILLALESLLSTKDLGEIYVSDLVEASGVSRKTFYRHFPDKYAAAEALFARFYQATFHRIIAGANWEEALFSYLCACEEKAAVLLHAYNGMDYNGLRRYDIEMTARTYQNYLTQRQVDCTTPEMRFAIRIVSAGGTDMVIDWICSGMKQSKEELVYLIRRTLPEDIKQNLL